MAKDANLLIQREQDVTLVDFQEARLLDAHHIESLAAQLYRLVDQMDRKKLILDFSKVQLLSSSAISVMLNLHKKSTAIKGKLILCGMRPEIKKIFEIMKLTKLLKIVGDANEAKAQFK